MWEKVGVTHRDRPAFDLPRVDVPFDLGRVLAEVGDKAERILAGYVGDVRAERCRSEAGELILGGVRGPGTV